MVTMDELQKICDLYETEGVDKRSWESMRQELQDLIIDELLRRNKNRPYALAGFQYNPETGTYQDEKIRMKWEKEKEGVQYANEDTRRRRDDTKGLRD